MWRLRSLSDLGDLKVEVADPANTLGIPEKMSC